MGTINALFNRSRTKGLRLGLIGGAFLLCAAAPAPGGVSGWSPTTLERLEAWIAKAPEDALPMLDTGPLKRAQASGDRAAIDDAASELALRLARMHLLGSATAAQRAGWHVYDSDVATDLSERLGRAVAFDMMDSFFAGLRPTNPSYAALRAAYAAETDPERRLTVARNMERWRWMPRSLGRNYVLVNAPAFEAELWRDGSRVGVWPDACECLGLGIACVVGRAGECVSDALAMIRQCQKFHAERRLRSTRPKRPERPKRIFRCQEMLKLRQLGPGHALVERDERSSVVG